MGRRVRVSLSIMLWVAALGGAVGLMPTGAIALSGSEIVLFDDISGSGYVCPDPSGNIAEALYTDINITNLANLGYNDVVSGWLQAGGWYGYSNSGGVGTEIVMTAAYDCYGMGGNADTMSSVYHDPQ